MKISVVTITMRDDIRLKKQRDFLDAQTFPHDEFEWIIVDDFYKDRVEMVPEWGESPFPITHVGPYILKDYSAPSAAANTGLLHASGELVHLMVDYMKPSLGLLQRHWDIYQEYGPRVVISSLFTPGNGQTSDVDRPIDISIEDGLGEITDVKKIGGKFWAGRCDTIPLKEALDVNGFDERFDGIRAGMDVIFGMKLIKNGNRWLLDQKEPAQDEFLHAPHRKGLSDEEWGKLHPGLVWQDVFWAAAGGDTWTPNEINLRERRKELWGVLA